MYTSFKSPHARSPVTVPHLHELKAKREKIVALTAYDASFIALCGEARVVSRQGDDLLALGLQFVQMRHGHRRSRVWRFETCIHGQVGPRNDALSGRRPAVLKPYR